ncbi:ParA family protein [Solidesulfovibrio carbinolicus]|uniref:Chromosome partitioning protein n=1 Tax=Solidesulfovibrio carbinolicus TaxID=296842 RepID=A0A4P6HQE5_9BACT|nr:AAA family ATPase [Solidesulfovibrio carbinolicus]QAZ68996.1 chromosome partitioning protein [Solidesulfovibrio carbinolicus]
MTSLVFFNNKGGVGKTVLVYHLAWMYASLGIRTLAVDLDPQANLTSMFLDEAALEDLWPDGEHPGTLYGAIKPILRGRGDIAPPTAYTVGEALHLLPGDLGLSGFEDKLSDAWPKCHNKDEAAFRVTTAFYRIIEQVAADVRAEITLIDIGPNLGAINRSALLAVDAICVPLAPDLFSLQGLKNLGPTLQDWREAWHDMRKKAPADLPVPDGKFKPLGYVVMQHGFRESRPVKAYKRWMDRIPATYQEYILGKQARRLPSLDMDPNCLAILKHYRSLMPMAMEANKPMFSLKPSDGAIGSHVEAVKKCFDDFDRLARRIANKTDIMLF